jgi:hypothetical protein
MKPSILEELQREANERHKNYIKPRKQCTRKTWYQEQVEKQEKPEPKTTMPDWEQLKKFLSNNPY